MLGTAASSIRGGRPRRLPCLRGLRSCPLAGRSIWGAGTGRHARWLGDAGWTVNAVDFSSVAIELARSGGEDRSIDYTVADVRAWEPPGPVDLVAIGFPASTGRRVGCRHCRCRKLARTGCDGCCISVMRSITSLTESGARRIRRSCPPSTTSPAPRADCRSTSWNIWSALSARVGPSMFFSMHSRGAPQLTVI